MSHVVLSFRILFFICLTLWPVIRAPCAFLSCSFDIVHLYFRLTVAGRIKGWWWWLFTYRLRLRELCNDRCYFSHIKNSYLIQFQPFVSAGRSALHFRLKIALASMQIWQFSTAQIWFFSDRPEVCHLTWLHRSSKFDDCHSVRNPTLWVSATRDGHGLGPSMGWVRLDWVVQAQRCT